MPARRERKTRISKRVRIAIEAMVFDGLSRAEAAKRAGCSDNWIYQQLRRSEVLALRNELMQVLRTGEALRSIARIASIADNDNTPASTKLEANKLLLALDSGAPVERNQYNIPGLQIVFEPPQPAPQIEGQARTMTTHSDASLDTKSSKIDTHGCRKNRQKS